MKRAIILSGALVLGPVGAYAQDQRWTNFFSSAVAAYRASSGDQFAELKFPAPPYGDVIRVPISEAGPDNLADRSAIWRYDPGKLSITVIFEGLNDRDPMWRNGLIVWSKAAQTGSYVASNAFGAKATVRKIRKDTVAIDLASAPFRRRSTLHFTFPMSGAEARVASRRLVLEMNVATRPESSAPMACSSSYDSAEFRSPVEIDGATCVFSASIDSFRIVRADTGEVLADANDPDFDDHFL